MSDKFNIKEIAPASDVDPDEGWVNYNRSKAFITHHFAGTARMGNDIVTVVDPQLRVPGVNKLGVIYVLVMPTITYQCSGSHDWGERISLRKGRMMAQP